jgi:hypothetical protein
MATSNRIEGIAGGSGRGPGGYSYRGSELSAAERRALVKQNKSAESLKNKDLDKLEKNKARYKTQKEATAKRILQEKKTVAGKAGVAGVALGAVAQMAVDKVKAQKKSTAKATPKVTPKATPKAKPRKYTKSEQNFLDGQKLKKKILKKTGVYPNTAT